MSRLDDRVRRWLAALACGAALTSACGERLVVEGGRGARVVGAGDAGAGAPGAGPGGDAGAGLGGDGGGLPRPHDGGASADAGEVTDAGGLSDAGGLADAGTEPDAGPATPSEPPPDMRAVVDALGRRYFIDRYEASLAPGSGALGSDDQDLDDDGKVADAEVAAAHTDSHGLRFDDDGGEEAVVRTAAVARSVGGALPAELSFYQAAAACTRAGKRLCTGAEWRVACQGAAAPTRYPYGDSFDGADGRGADCWTSGLSPDVQPTGTASGCVSVDGVFNLSGNVEEWTDYRDPAAALARGGNALSTEDNVTCGAALPQRPDVAFLRLGFRCCRTPSDAPTAIPPLTRRAAPR